MLVLDHSLEFSVRDHSAWLLWHEVDPTAAAHGGAKPFNSRPEAKAEHRPRAFNSHLKISQ